MKNNFINFVNRSEHELEIKIEDYNNRHAYNAKVNTFTTDGEGLSSEYEKI